MTSRPAHQSPMGRTSLLFSARQARRLTWRTALPNEVRQRRHPVSLRAGWRFEQAGSASRRVRLGKIQRLDPAQPAPQVGRDEKLDAGLRM